jgi:hypothetical protein
MLALAPDEALYFLHIPKTAGMTLSNILDDYFDESEIFPTHFMPDLSLNRDILRSINDARYRLYRGHFNQYLFHLVRKPLSVVTILRDPIARTISNIRYGLDLAQSGENVFWLKNGVLSFDDFMAHEELHRFQSNIQFDCLAGELRWLENQLLPLGIKASETLTEDKLYIAQERLRSYRVVGIQERFDDSLLLLSYELGFPPPKEYANENVSARKRSKAELAPEHLEKLRAMNELDYELYETAVEIFEQRFQAMCDHLNRLYPDQIGDLHAQLDAYYQQRLMESDAARWRVASQDAALCYTFDRPLPGSGWHRREALPATETAPERLIRWTGPGDEATLSLGLPTAHPLQVRISVIDFVNTTARDILHLTVNDVEIPLLMEMEEDTILYRGVIPHTVLAEEGKPQRLTLTTPPGLLSEKYPGEKRRTGVAVAAIEFTPMLPLPSDEPLVLDFSGEMLGQNWHVVEIFEEQPTRWTDGQVATLPLRIDPHQAYHVVLETLGFASEEALNSFRLRVNSTELPLQMRPSERSPHRLEFTTTLPVQALLPEPNYQLFQFEVDSPTTVDVTEDGSIKRVLGVRMMSMTLEPVREPRHASELRFPDASSGSRA